MSKTIESRFLEDVAKSINAWPRDGSVDELLQKIPLTLMSTEKQEGES